MVQALVDGLPQVAPEIQLHHVNPRLSRDAADIGRWRIAKCFWLLVACVRALALRARHGAMVFYYVPAPGKRGALYRDFVVMLLCRPFFRSLVLHWHAVGLGEWLTRRANTLERQLAQQLLGRADLAIALAPECLADANVLQPRRTAVVSNGIDLPITTSRHERATESRACEVLFLGLCTREKGLFDTLAAVALANRRSPGAFRLTVAGSFRDDQEQRDFTSRAAALGPGVAQYFGFVDGAKKEQLWSSADVLCCPTFYPHEGQPLTVIEALAHDVPIIATRWRALPSLLPPTHTWLVEPGQPGRIADALMQARARGPANGALREHYLVRFTRARHLAALASALHSARPA